MLKDEKQGTKVSMKSLTLMLTAAIGNPINSPKRYERCPLCPLRPAYKNSIYLFSILFFFILLFTIIIS